MDRQQFSERFGCSAIVVFQLAAAPRRANPKRVFVAQEDKLIFCHQRTPQAMQIAVSPGPTSTSSLRQAARGQTARESACGSPRAAKSWQLHSQGKRVSNLVQSAW